MKNLLRFFPLMMLLMFVLGGAELSSFDLAGRSLFFNRSSSNAVRASSIYQGGWHITMCGPSGGTGGEIFNDYPGVVGSRIAELRVRSGVFIDSIQVIYENQQSYPPHGGNGGSLSVFKLDPDEYIIRIGGKYGDYVDSLAIVTNKGREQRWGGGGGKVVFVYAAPKGSWIGGFFGRSGKYLDAIGVNIVTP